MPSSSAKLGLGTILNIGGAVVEVSEVSISPSRDSVDVTNHDSTAPSKEFIAGMTDGGEVSFKANFRPGSHATLLGYLFATTSMNKSCSITWADGTAWSFTGFVKSLSPSSTPTDKMTLSGTVKVTGLIA